MAEPLSVAVRRGEIVESVHRVHAVAVPAATSSRGRRPELCSARCAPRRSRSRRCRSPARARSSTTSDLAIASASHFGTSDARRGRPRAPPQDGRRRGRARLRAPGRPAAGAVHHNCSGKHAGDDRRLPRARLAGRGLPPARAPASAWAGSTRWPRRRELASGRRRDGDRRLRRRLLRAPARAGRACAFSRCTSLDGGERDRRGDASAARAVGGRGRDRHDADAHASGLDRQGRRGGPPLRRVAGRPRARARGRGRELEGSAPRAGRLRDGAWLRGVPALPRCPSPTATASRPRSSASCRRNIPNSPNRV